MITKTKMNICLKYIDKYGVFDPQNNNYLTQKNSTVQHINVFFLRDET